MNTQKSVLSALSVLVVVHCSAKGILKQRLTEDCRCIVNERRNGKLSLSMIYSHCVQIIRVIEVTNTNRMTSIDT